MIKFAVVGSSLPQVPFELFMQQQAQQDIYKGCQVVGTRLWQYRFDTDTLRAAGAAEGQGTWQEAEVVAYDQTTGECEVRQHRAGSWLVVLHTCTHIRTHNHTHIEDCDTLRALTDDRHTKPIARRC